MSTTPASPQPIVPDCATHLTKKTSIMLVCHGLPHGLHYVLIRPPSVAEARQPQDNGCYNHGMGKAMSFSQEGEENLFGPIGGMAPKDSSLPWLQTEASLRDMTNNACGHDPGSPC